MNLVGDTGAEHGSLFFITIPDKQHKLIAAQTDLEILFRGGAAQYIGHFQKDGIGKGGSLFLIKLAEIVHIQEHQNTVFPFRFFLHTFLGQPCAGLLIP